LRKDEKRGGYRIFTPENAEDAEWKSFLCELGVLGGKFFP
jgi:hypothetical protein